MQKRYLAFAIVSILIGVVLRQVCLGDMEFKLDQQYTWERVQNVGKTEPWPWLGMPSGVSARNPGMSVWVFLVTAKLFEPFLGMDSPVDLARSVSLLNCLAMILLLLFVVKGVPEKDREPWLWAVILIPVNPVLVWLHRIIWAQSILPIFCLAFLVGWWFRRKPWGALFWGVVGASLGQIHMSGFFFAFAIFLWTAIFDRQGVRWIYWVVGSTVAALPLIPWVENLLLHPSVSQRGANPLELRFYVFWLSDPMGFHLGNTLGVHRGHGVLAQNEDFFRYPILWGRATYGVAVAHVGALVAAVGIFGRHLWSLRTLHRDQWKKALTVSQTPDGFLKNAVLLAYGPILTATTILVRKYYVMVTFPLQWIWWSRIALEGGSKAWGRRLLILTWVSHLIVSAYFLVYVRDHEGSRVGDYGIGYQYQRGGVSR